jgi:hypothetical protein
MNQPTSEIYGVWMDNEFPYNVYGAQQDNSTLDHHEPGEPVRHAGVPRRPGLRDRADHAAPEGSEHRLWILQGPVRMDELEDGAVEALLGRRTVALWQPRQRI